MVADRGGCHHLQPVRGAPRQVGATSSICCRRHHLQGSGGGGEDVARRPATQMSFFNYGEVLREPLEVVGESLVVVGGVAVGESLEFVGESLKVMGGERFTGSEVGAGITFL